MAVYERLPAQDAAFLYFESLRTHMHLGGLLVFEESDGDLTDLRGHVSARLQFAPRLRKRLMWVPFGQGRPVWVDDEAFDIRYHVRQAALPAPAGHPELHRLMGEVMSRRLDRDRPLWELWLVDMDDGKRGLIYKAHHATVDGLAAVDLAMIVLDITREVDPIDHDDWVPEPPPTSSELLSDTLVESARAPAGWIDSAKRAIRQPQQTRERLVEFRRGLRRLGENALGPAPRNVFSAKAGAQRLFDTVRLRFDDLLAVKRSYEVTINDVVLSLVAGGLRYLLISRGTDVTGLRLRTAVPVSTRGHPGSAPNEERGQLGNKLSMLFADLPVDEPDPAQRLAIIHDQMTQLKADDVARTSDILMRIAQDLPPVVFSAVGRGLAVQWTMNLTVTNLPGPDFPLYCMGGRVLEIAPYAPVFAQTPLSVAGMSYDGNFTFGLAGDWHSMGDVDVLADGLAKSLADLGV